MSFGDLCFTVGTDDLLYIPANTEYVRRSYEDEEIVAIHFNISNCELFTPELIRVDSEECSRLFLELYKIWSEKKSGFKYRCTSLLYGFLSTVVNEKEPSKEYVRLERSIEYIEKNLPQKISVSELASLCGMCETQYRKLFKKEFGTSPVKYINRLRISIAVSMLYSTCYSMAEISELCGFSDQKYFNKIFREETGKSPIRYKKEYFFTLAKKP